MASYQDGSPVEFSHGHKREQSQDSGAYIDWNSEDSASPVGNPDASGNEDFVTVVAVDNGGKTEPTSFVTILAIGETDEVEEEVLVYRLPGERLGFGLKFEGGTNTAENVKRLFIQSSAPDSPASRAKCSWGFLVEGDEILKIDGHVVKDMTRLDCVRCLKESSVVIKLYVRHKNEKVNKTDIRVNNDSSPTVISAEMKKTIPPPPPVPPRKIARKSPTKEGETINPPEGFCDTQSNPIPKARNIQPVTDINSSKYVIKVPQKGSHESPDVAKRIVKRTGSNLKLVPPEPKVYLDLLATEDSKNCESESDDTGSTISTVVGMSIPNTTNSSFCDSTNPPTPTSEPSTPVLDLSKIYEHTNNEFLFTKLINGKDHDSISYEEKISSDDILPLQPPLSFQDAPLSYGNEEMRASLTETLEFQTEVTKTPQEILIESEFEGKLKDSLKPTVSKKPSLIPRLAKTIGLLSPPKPNPRKESTPEKSRFKKKPPPLPLTWDNFSNGDSEIKTLKSSIPYLKKKKVKSDESKKKKSKSSNGGDETHEKLNSLPKDDVEDVKKEPESPKTPEIDRNLTWEVPEWKSSKGGIDGVNITKETDALAVGAEPKIFLPEFESGEDITGGCESNFLFQWGGSKQLETIGEDEEDSSIEGVPDRCANNKQKKEEELPTQIVKEMEENSQEGEIRNSQDQKGEKNEKEKEEENKKEKEEENEKEKEESISELKGDDVSIPTAKETEVVQNVGFVEVKQEESEANGPKHKSDLSNNHVLLNLDNDSEIINNFSLNPSDGEMKKVMVPAGSTTVGLASTPSYSRMPPDGHEFPQGYAEEPNTQDDGVVPPLPASEPPSSPSSKSSFFLNGERDISDAKCGRTNRDVIKSGRSSFWRQDEKSEKSVRDKIAMFSSVPESESPAKLNKYKSTEDVLFYDETDCRNFRNGKLFSQSILSLDKVSPFKKPYGVTSGPRSLEFTNRTQSSMDLSSSSAYSSSCSPDSSLSSNSSYLGYSSTLPRKKTNKPDKKETGVHRTTSFSAHGRSQSLLNVNAPYKTRYSSEILQEDGAKPCSLNLLIEQRRKNLSKLRGLVIPEKLSNVVPAQPIVDLPEIKSKDLILSSKVPNASIDKTKNKWVASESSVAPKISPTHLWDQTKMPNIPKYSPAFKRKSISVFGSKDYSVKAPIKPPRNLQRIEDKKYQDVNLSDGETYFSDKSQKYLDSPRRKSTPLGKYRLHAESGRSEEDSDNDSAVSSSRSSISHGFSPPASPLPDSQYQVADDSGHRSTLFLSSSERTPLTRTPSTESSSAVSNISPLTLQANIGSNDANNKRVLKPQSVEAINRKNVLASAKYSRGFDSKTGSPLIQRKFSENIEENYFTERKTPENVKVAYITDVVESKKKLEKSESLPVKPPSAQSVAARKTSVPFAYSWETDQDEPKDETKFLVKDKLDKVLKFSCSKVKSENTAGDSESSKSLISSTSIQQNAKRDPKSAQNSEKIASGGRRSASVNDIRKAFEKIETGVSPASGRMTSKTVYCGLNGNHVRVSSLDSTNSEENCALVQGQFGFSSLQREQFGSITSLASSTSLISPQELQLLIEEANQTLEESGSNGGGSSPNNHDVLVVILHRDTIGGSVGITLAGGADYESKEITVHKVLAGSPADRDGRIQKGDRILSINGKSMKGVTHRESLAILKSPRLEVVLVVSRLKSEAHSEGANPDDAIPATVRHSFLSGSSRPPRILEGKSLSESDGPRVAEVDVMRGPPVTLKLFKDGAGLGFSLEGGKDCPTGDRPLVIKKIFTGGAAEKCGELKAGDEILNVNGVDVSVMSRIEVWKLMKQLPDGNVTITVRHQA